MENKISNYIDKFVGKRIPGLQISITKGNDIVFSKGYGYADIDKEVLVDNNTTFNYASVSKLFIWVSVMQLVEQGKLNLDGDILKYIPDYKINFIEDKHITLLDLMNHTSGLEAAWASFDENGVPHSSSYFNSLEEALTTGYANNLVFTPGEVVSYSNLGSTIAALIVEKVSGKAFCNYVIDNIFTPASMNCTYPEQVSVASLLEKKAVGYRFKNDEFKITEVYEAKWLYPSGSVIGTAEDLSKFAISLFSGKLFKEKATLNKMFSTSYFQTDDELFSLHHGFFGTGGNSVGIGHTGVVEGMSSHFLINPEDNTSVSILINEQKSKDIALGLVKVITGEYVPGKFDELPDINLFAGQYVKTRTSMLNRKDPFEVLTVEVKDNKLIFDNEEYVQIKPYLFEEVKSSVDTNLKNKYYFKKFNETYKIVTIDTDWLNILELESFNAPK